MESVREETETHDTGEDEEMEEEESSSGEEEEKEGVEGVEEEGDEEDPSPANAKSKSRSRSAESGDSENEDPSDQESSSSRRSRAPSPTESLVEHTASMQLATPSPNALLSGEGEDASPGPQDPSGHAEREGAPPPSHRLSPDAPRSGGRANNGVDGDAIKELVASDLSKRRARQASKYHSKRSTRKIGRAKGSKAKQDTRVDVDRGGFWG